MKLLTLILAFILALLSSNVTACKINKNVKFINEKTPDFFEQYKLTPLTISGTVIRVPNIKKTIEHIDHNSHSAIIVSQSGGNIQKIAVLKISSKITHNLLDMIYKLAFDNNISSLSCSQINELTEIFGDIDTRKQTEVVLGYIRKKPTLTISGVSVFEKPMLVTRHFYKLEDSFYIIDIYRKN